MPVQRRREWGAESTRVAVLEWLPVQPERALLATLEGEQGVSFSVSKKDTPLSAACLLGVSGSSLFSLSLCGGEPWLEKMFVDWEASMGDEGSGTKIKDKLGQMKSSARN